MAETPPIMPPAAPATARNREPLLRVLRRILPAAPVVLEIAAGGGEHALFLAGRIPDCRWLATDADPAARRIIAARIEAAGAANILPPEALDAARPPWEMPGDFRPDVILCVNMIHIAPWEACTGLMAGAGALLPAGGLLVLYGPFIRDDRQTAESNAAFDLFLRRQNPAWGVRDLADVTMAAGANRLVADGIFEMPANNLVVAFRRRNEPAPAGPGRASL